MILITLKYLNLHNHNRHMNFMKPCPSLREDCQKQHKIQFYKLPLNLCLKVLL